MTHQDAIRDLVRLWDLLPLLVGSPWAELEPSLLDALEYLTAAATDDEHEQRAGQILRLCMPHRPLVKALEAAILRDGRRSGDPEPASWPQTIHEVTTTIDRSGRVGDDQWLVASLENHVTGEPVQPGHGYILAIGIAAGEPPATASISEPVPSWAGPRPGEASRALTVMLRGDADIETLNAGLTLPQQGASPDFARFRVTPRRGADRLTLTAVVMQDGMFVQVLTLTVGVADSHAATRPQPVPPPTGAGIRVVASGRPLAAAAASGRPDATLLMVNGEIVLTTPSTVIARLPYSQEQLTAIAEIARSALREIAWGVLDRHAAHQANVDIPPESYELSLTALVRAGRLMFSRLFFGHEAPSELSELGHALQHLAAQDGPLWVEVAAETHILPWHLLAFADDDDLDAARPSSILGLRHRVTYCTMQRGTRHRVPPMNLRPSEGPLRVVLGVNRDIDEHGRIQRDLAERQIEGWQRRAAASGGALSVTVPSEQEISNVLTRNKPAAELLYFFCHAHGQQDAEHDRLGPTAACLEFTGGHTVSLDDLLLSLPSANEFDAAPLVLLNACASLTPASPYLGSFLLYLLGRGARGVIGTEADVPPVLAATWAEEFFSRVLDGVPLMDAAFELTADLAERHRNLLGLAYALHCDGRSLVWPAIPGADH